MVLDMIMEQLITIRGFSCVSAFIEQYKKGTGNAHKKSKGVRKTLISSNSSSTSGVTDKVSE